MQVGMHRPSLFPNKPTPADWCTKRDTSTYIWDRVRNLPQLPPANRGLAHVRSIRKSRPNVIVSTKCDPFKSKQIRG